jgi:hypothetical protein
MLYDQMKERERGAGRATCAGHLAVATNFIKDFIFLNLFVHCFDLNLVICTFNFKS